MSALPELSHTFASALPELLTPVRAAQFPTPRAVVINDDLARALGADPQALRADPAPLVGAVEHTAAMAYAGHQFGMYVPRLGDGRALLLGEATLIETGSEPRRVDLHLKGSGPTPFARGGDGYAALGPMLREYLVSEAMHALGIPTSRSLAVVSTGAVVHREVPLPGAVLTRVGASHIRVGTFQLARGNEEVLTRLTDYAIARHYPHLAGDYLGFYRAVIEAQARLVARWLGVGFVHGVMNTDNTTISGETIDYGPCAFLDTYQEQATFSSIDHHGRYSYGNQPAVAAWNLARFGEALLPLVGSPEQAQEALSAFEAAYGRARGEVFARKLGLSPGPQAEALATEFLDLLATEGLDFTNSFRALSDSAEPPSASAAMATWWRQWREADPVPARAAAANPVYIPRNLLLERALNEATEGDLAPFLDLAELVTDPFTHRPGTEAYRVGGPGGFRTFCGT